MAEYKSINTRIVTRNADLSNWLTSEVVLLKGEMALAKLSGEYDGNYEVRIGDGIHKWRELTGNGKLIIQESQVSGLTEKIQSLSTTYLTCNDIATLSSKTYTNGDIAVEKKAIADDKEEYCAYRWNKELSVWQALDGNYSAENVYFKDNITLAGDYTSVGNIKLTDKTIPASGKSVKTVFDNIFTKELSGKVDKNPSVTGTWLKAKVNGAGSLVQAAKSYEYGTYLTELAFGGASFTKGTYTYGPTSEQSITGWTTSGNGLAITSGSTSNSGTCENVCIGDQGKDTDNPTLASYTTASSFSVTTKGYTLVDTVEAKTNLGNTNTSAGFSKVQFAANQNLTEGKESGRFTGYRCPFWGTKAKGSQIDFSGTVTSTQIRGLGQGNVAQTSETVLPKTWTVPAGTFQIVFACKHDTNGYKKISVTDISNPKAPFTVAFDKYESKANVEGANGYTAVAYDVFTVTLGEPYPQEASLQIAWSN